MRRVLTGANAITVSGSIFSEWKTGTYTREWISEDDRIRIRPTGKRHEHEAIVDGESLGRFETRFEAMREALKILG